ncbi:MAG: hypothetical protein ACE5KA_09325 [Nitrososphaerales archaeon]
MAEPFIATMYAMTAVMIVLVAVLFGIRGARHGRAHKKETEGETAT